MLSRVDFPHPDGTMMDTKTWPETSKPTSSKRFHRIVAGAKNLVEMLDDDLGHGLTPPLYNLGVEELVDHVLLADHLGRLGARVDDGRQRNTRLASRWKTNRSMSRAKMMKNRAYPNTP